MTMMEVRLAATRYIWGGFALMMFGLFGSTIFGDSTLGLAHILIGGMLAFAAFLSTGMVWNWGQGQQGEDVRTVSIKQKRGSVERLADELDSMSDEELHRLRSRLSGDVRDVLSTSAYGLNDEGELLRR